MMHAHELKCFKTYDIRGELDVNLDAGVAYRVSRAAHLRAETLVIERDARNFAGARRRRGAA